MVEELQAEVDRLRGLLALNKVSSDGEGTAGGGGQAPGSAGAQQGEL